MIDTLIVSSLPGVQTTGEQQESGIALRRGERRKQHTKRRLLDAAADVYALGSVESATISSITDKADVGLGTFYLHFEDKDAIACSVSQTFLRRILAEEEAALEAVRSVGGQPDPLALFARVIASRASENPGLTSALLRWEGPSSPKITDDGELVGFRAGLVPQLSTRFQAGLANGLYREEDPALASQALLGMFTTTIPAFHLTGAAEWNTLASFLERTILSMFRR